MDIQVPSFLKPDFAAGPCCWSHSMRTRVWVIKCFIQVPRATMAIASPGEKAANKRLNPTAANVPRLSLVAAVTAAAAAAAVSRAAFHFPSLLAGNDLNLGEGWGSWCLLDR